MRKLFNKLQRPETEAILWIIGLVYLYFVNPYETHHYTFCAFKLVGIESCPGCGLGRSIAFIYHGDILTSIKTHPLGIFALLLISYRIIKLFSKSKLIQQLIRGVKNGRRFKTIT